MKRYVLPPLDLVQGFEAAARTLSFTKAAEELHLTQSAISRQIRALEESLGVPLFERRTRALALTADGRRLQRSVEDALNLLQETTNRIRAEARVQHLTVSTTPGFASLWLIPRLRRFTQLNPEVDVRISAGYKPVPLERGDADIAVRYSKEDAAPADGLRLFGEEVTPVCSPLLSARGNGGGIGALKDLARHTLLHMDSAHGILDWETWLVAEGLGDLKPAASLRFDNYDQLIQAALDAQGVALGIRRLVQHLLDDGRLVVPFGKSMVSKRAYYVLRSPLLRTAPHADAFIAWLRQEAEACVKADAAHAPPLSKSSASSRRRAAPKAGASRPAR